MQVPLQISFQNLKPSAGLESAIRKRAEGLERYFPRITSVRTVVSLSSRRPRQGNLYQVRVDVTLLDGELVIGREATLNHAHEDPYVAVRDAFLKARRRIVDSVQIHFRK